MVLLFGRFSKKVVAIWQWWHRIRSTVPEAKKILLLNLDETSVRFFYPPKPGLRLRKSNLPKSGLGCKRKASKGQQRKALTYVGLVCNDVEAQKHLPQIAIVAEQLISEAELNRVRASLPDKMQVWRRKSGWVNNLVFTELMTCLGTAVRRAAPESQPVLLMDAHKVHFSNPVLRAARRANVRVLILPANCTHLLQVLDTDVFARFKAFFRHRLHARMSVGPNQDLSGGAILAELGETIRNVVQGMDWSSAFLKNGFGPHEPFARRTLMKALEWDEIPELPKEMPSYGAFQSIFPRGSVIPFDLLLQPRPPQRQPAGVAAPPPVHPAAPEPAPEEPWSRRLRPRRSTSHLDVPTAAASGSVVGEPALPPPPLPPPAEPPPPVMPDAPRARRLGPPMRSRSNASLPPPL